MLSFTFVLSRLSLMPKCQLLHHSPPITLFLRSPFCFSLTKHQFFVESVSQNLRPATSKWSIRGRPYLSSISFLQHLFSSAFSPALLFDSRPSDPFSVSFTNKSGEITLVTMHDWSLVSDQADSDPLAENQTSGAAGIYGDDGAVCLRKVMYPRLQYRHY